VLIVLAALNDALTAVIAVVALLIGVVFIARGPRGEAAVPASDHGPGDKQPPAIPIAAPAKATAGTPPPTPTTFRQGTIKLGLDAPPAAAPAAAPPTAAPPAPAPPQPPAPPEPPVAREEPPEPPVAREEPGAPPEPSVAREALPEPEPPKQPPTPRLPAWKRRLMPAPLPPPPTDQEPSGDTPAPSDSQAPFKHGSIRFRR
jgi:hypothetical protein